MEYGISRRAVPGEFSGRSVNPVLFAGHLPPFIAAKPKRWHCECITKNRIGVSAGRPVPRAPHCLSFARLQDRRFAAQRQQHTTRAIWNPGAVWQGGTGSQSQQEGVAVQTLSPPQTVRVVVGGSWWAVAVLFCTTVICLASAVTAFILYVRPLLLKAERASEKMEKAAEEMEKAAQVMNLDLPYTLDATERAGLEFEELGKTLNMLSGGLRRSPAKRQPPSRQRRPGVPLDRRRDPATIEGRRDAMGTSEGPADVGAAREAIASTANAASGGEDGATAEAGPGQTEQWTSTAVAWLRAITPAMEGWRTRIGRLARGFELYKREREAAAESAAANEREAREWIETWRQRNGGDDEASASNGAKQEMHTSGSNGVLAPMPSPPRGNLAQGLASKVAGTVAKVASALPGSRDGDSGQPPANGKAALNGRTQELSHSVSSEAASYRAEAEAAASQQQQSQEPNQADSRLTYSGTNSTNGSPPPSIVPGEAIQRFGALTSAERRLVRRLSDKREAAEAVFTALFHAEKAAAAAAQASGELESALQRAGHGSESGGPAGRRGDVSMSMTIEDDDDDNELPSNANAPRQGRPSLWL